MSRSPEQPRCRHHRRLPAVVLIVFVAAMMVAPTAARAANGFSVTPMLVEMTIDPGKSDRASLAIRNAYDDPVTFRLSTVDIKGSNTPALNPIILGGRVNSPISGAGWIKPESSLRVGAGRTATADVTVSVPADAAEGSGHYAAVIVSGPSQQVSGDTVTAQSRIAVLFFINAGRKRPPVVTFDDVVTEVPGEIVYENDGDSAATDTKVEVEYVNPITGSVVARSSGKCGTALPESRAACTVPEVDPSSPLVRRRVTLTSGGRTVRAEQPIEWAGPGKSLLLPAAGLLLLLFWFRRGRREDDEDHDSTMA